MSDLCGRVLSNAAPLTAQAAPDRGCGHRGWTRGHPEEADTETCESAWQVSTLIDKPALTCSPRSLAGGTVRSTARATQTTGLHQITKEGLFSSQVTSHAVLHTFRLKTNLFISILKVFRRRNTETDFNSWTKQFIAQSPAYSLPPGHVPEEGNVIAGFLRNKTDCDTLTQGQGSLLSDALKLVSILGLYVCIRKLETFIKWNYSVEILYGNRNIFLLSLLILFYNPQVCVSCPLHPSLEVCQEDLENGVMVHQGPSPP